MPVYEIADPRRNEPGYLLAEREMVEAWLEFHRATLLLKCEGLDNDARKRRPVPSSALSLHGLVRHMAEVERHWFRAVLDRDETAVPIWGMGATDEDFEVSGASWVEDLATWRAECEASRRVAAARSLEQTGARRGQPVSLRWIYNHMVEEYARHNGHADILREMLDGAVGW